MSLKKFDLEEYKKDMETLCGDPADCKFPDRYFGNIRPWDYSKVIEYGEFNKSNFVLETGALHSYFCIYLSQFVDKYICTDSFYWATNRDYASNEDYYQTPQEWCDYITKKSEGRVLGAEADLQKLQYPSDTFDRVVCISVIEHVHEDRKGIEEMMRVLKPGGLLLLTTEYNKTGKPYSEDDGSFYRVYNKSGLDILLKDYKIEKTEIHGEVPANDGFTTMFIKVRKDK